MMLGLPTHPHHSPARSLHINKLKIRNQNSVEIVLLAGTDYVIDIRHLEMKSVIKMLHILHTEFFKSQWQRVFEDVIGRRKNFIKRRIIAQISKADRLN